MVDSPTAFVNRSLPPRVRNYRRKRYSGDDVFSAVGDFTPEDQRAIRRLYAFLTRLFEALNGVRDQTSLPENALEQTLGIGLFEELVAEIQGFGVASYRANPSESLAKTIHDLRGGGLTSLLGHLQMIALSGSQKIDPKTLYLLARDHLKIMRNALVGLDDVKRNEDLQPKQHCTSLLVEKWSNASFKAGKDVRVQVASQFDGAISECCVEFGALDRILYNLMNNAARHTAGQVVDLAMIPLPADEPEDLRFLISNRVDSGGAQKLRELAGMADDLRSLFTPGVSSTGSGYGLTIVTDFIVNAYGLGNRASAFTDGYLGARLIDDCFVAWFHWPISHAV